MHIDYQKLCKNPRNFRAVTGMNQSEYEQLIPRFTTQYNKYKSETSKAIQREQGAGRKAKVFEKPSKLLFYTLFFIRVYPTFDLASVFFNLSRSQCHFWFYAGLIMLERTVKSEIPLPAKTEKVNNLNDMFRKIPALKEHIIDATEQPIFRYKDKDKQKEYYSGKKKRHTVKRHVLTSKEGFLIGVSNTVKGTLHDKKLADKSMYMCHAPPDSVCLGDSGYQGLEGMGLSIKVITPVKKRPKRKLSIAQKEFNRVLSSVRVRSEHVIGHMKINNIYSERLRYKDRQYDDYITNVVGGLYNYKRRMRKKK